MSAEERFKALFVPGRLQTLYHLARERRRGEQEIRLVPVLADRSRVSLDIGANKGVWSEALRPHSSSVHAFEPNPKIHEVLRRGIGSGVTVHDIALSDTSGSAELRVPRHRSGGYSNQGASLSTEKIGAAEYGSVVVDARRLDDLDLGEVGFIKIDVEGFELAVVEGARETLRRHRPNMVIEIEEKHTRRPIAELLGAVCAHGYQAFALDRGVLRRTSQIDLALRHSTPASRRDYIFNWIFLPG
ncbi:FkbM family methyltransferase [Falsiroseomonas sp. HC035]|uniref:FkbM family methyltransferase n=1 Tax=Falsiroseomonas sp. HC035 TaxID=3390999 RepID=UPI003D30F865